MRRASTLTGLLAAATLAVTACAPAVETPAGDGTATSASIQGRLPDGSNYRAVMPPDWNGTLVLDLDFANDPDAAPDGIERWMVAHGYAIGGISREPVSYRFHQAVDNLLAVRQMVVDRWGVPTRTISFGVSRGAFVSRQALEQAPEVFDGALMTSGGGAGEIALFNSKLDGTWALATLLGADVQVAGWADRAAAADAGRAIGALVDEAVTTPAGRARLALAGAFEQLPTFAAGDAPPAADDHEARLDHLAMSFAAGNPMGVRAGIEAVMGGNVSWNHDVDYADLLARSGMQDLVEALYARAGLDLAADLATLASAPRLGADPAAVAEAERLTTYTGAIDAPVLVVDAIGDPFDPDAADRAFQRTVEEAGHADLLRMTWVRSARHATESELERLTGFVTMIARLDTGAWPDTSPAAMQARAEALDAATTLDLGPARFIAHEPPEMLRPWDGSDRGRYVPCAGRDPVSNICQ
jgi:hypothetical protein